MSGSACCRSSAGNCSYTEGKSLFLDLFVSCRQFLDSEYFLKFETMLSGTCIDSLYYVKIRKMSHEYHPILVRLSFTFRPAYVYLKAPRLALRTSISRYLVHPCVVERVACTHQRCEQQPVYEYDNVEDARR